MRAGFNGTGYIQQRQRPGGMRSSPFAMLGNMQRDVGGLHPAIAALIQQRLAGMGGAQPGGPMQRPPVDPGFFLGQLGGQQQGNNPLIGPDSGFDGADGLRQRLAALLAPTAPQGAMTGMQGAAGNYAGAMAAGPNPFQRSYAAARGRVHHDHVEQAQARAARMAGQMLGKLNRLFT